MALLLQEYVADQARRQPDAAAIVDGGVETSYGQLESLSNRIARVLGAAGCRRGDRVALLLPKSPASLAAMIGILKAGCAYVPIDLQAPAAYVADRIAQVQPRVLLADRVRGADLNQLRDLLGPAFPQLGWLDSGPAGERGLPTAFDLGDVMRAAEASPGCVSSPDDLAHILFTSGTTGVPKGVMITHRNVISFTEWAVSHLGMDSSDRIAAHSPLHYDGSTFDIFCALASGAALYPVPPELGLLPGALTAFIRGSRITHWDSVPWVFNYLARLNALRDGDFPDMRRVIWGGDVLPPPALVYWMRKLPHAIFTNVYGPTETTVANIHYTVPACPKDEREAIPIGVPCSNSEILILDARLQKCPAGQTGELYIGGAGLSLGYWRDAARTAQAFIAHPFTPGSRLYRTGDLARQGQDGLIHFLGRADTQIQVRGARVELGEVESALQLLKYLSDSAVVAVERGSLRELSICCAYVPAPGEDAPPGRVQRDLSERLPRVMVPSQWLRLERLPRNAAGKTDRQKLKGMFGTDRPHPPAEGAGAP